MYVTHRLNLLSSRASIGKWSNLAYKTRYVRAAARYPVLGGVIAMRRFSQETASGPYITDIFYGTPVTVFLQTSRFASTRGALRETCTPPAPLFRSLPLSLQVALPQIPSLCDRKYYTRSPSLLFRTFCMHRAGSGDSGEMGYEKGERSEDTRRNMHTAGVGTPR